MQKVFIGGIVLLLGGAIYARSRAAATGNPDPLVFVFLRVDPAQDVAILRPMIAPDLGVQLDSGPKSLEPGTVLQCLASAREHAAIVEGQTAKVSDLLLDCGERKFVVKTIEFTPKGK